MRHCVDFAVFVISTLFVPSAIAQMWPGRVMPIGPQGGQGGPPPLGNTFPLPQNGGMSMGGAFGQRMPLPIGGQNSGGASFGAQRMPIQPLSGGGGGGMFPSMPFIPAQRPMLPQNLGGMGGPNAMGGPMISGMGGPSMAGMNAMGGHVRGGMGGPASNAAGGPMISGMGGPSNGGMGGPMDSMSQMHPRALGQRQFQPDSQMGPVQGNSDAAPAAPTDSGTLPKFLEGAPEETIAEFKRIIRQPNVTYEQKVKEVEALVGGLDHTHRTLYSQFMTETDQMQQQKRDAIHHTVEGMSQEAQTQFAKISAILRNPQLPEEERWNRVLTVYGSLEPKLRDEFEDKFKPLA